MWQLSATETAGLPQECREPLRDLLIACADTKLLMGYHYGEWTFGAPMIEAAVAHCSLAQGELGHVRLLHGILKAHFDVDPDYLVERRPAPEFASNAYLNEPLPDWPSVVAMTVVVDHGVTRVIHALRDSSFQPLRNCAAKLLEEERYHLHHGQGWARTLAKDAAQRVVLRDALLRAWDATRQWFGPEHEPADAALLSAGVKAASNQDLSHALADDMLGLTTPLGVEWPPALETWFQNWSPKRRRFGPDGPSEEVLYHLRGEKNAVFKQA